MYARLLLFSVSQVVAAVNNSGCCCSLLVWLRLLSLSQVAVLSVL
jgi:hypothetical protein